MKIEQRSRAQALSLRAGDSVKTAAGYAALFNTRTSIGDYFIEEIRPGAFTKSMKGDVRALIDHDSGRVIGRTSAGTLRLFEDAKGLAVEIDLPETNDGRDLAIQLSRGDISGMSIGFRVLHDEWDETGELPVRTIHEIDLAEVSAVAFPAYPETSIALRSLDAARTDRKTRNFNAAARRLMLKSTRELQIRGVKLR